MFKQEIFYDGLPVGIAVPEDGCLKFIAVKFHVIELDNQKFKNIKELNKAIAVHLSSAVAA